MDFKKKEVLKKLTPQQEEFCVAYVELGCGKDAYLRAYPKSQHWASIDAVYSEASKVLSITKVTLRITELKSSLVKKNGITLQHVLDELLQSAYRSKVNGKEREVVNALGQISRILGLDHMSQKSAELVKAILYAPDNKRLNKESTGVFEE